MKSVAKAHANIALIKYWGKEDEQLFLPSTSSLSLTLDKLYTITSVSESDRDIFVLNGQIQNEKETQKISRFVDLFRTNNQSVKIESINYFPTAAGLASSASGYSALSVALNDFFGHHYDVEQLSKLTRRGSGSATRSLFGGFVKWKKGNNDQSVATPIEKEMDIEMIIVIVNEQQKKKDSRSLMKVTKEQSRYFESWTQYNDIDMQEMLIAIENEDIHQIGKIAERNAMMMHATLLAIEEPFFYIEPQSLEVISLIQELRQQGIVAYYTMDAGPNVKIITNSQHRPLILERLSAYQTIVAQKGPGATLL